MPLTLRHGVPEKQRAFKNQLEFIPIQKHLPQAAIGFPGSHALLHEPSKTNQSTNKSQWQSVRQGTQEIIILIILKMKK